MIRTVDLPCTGCGARADHVLYHGREHEYENTTDEWFPVVRCGACGLVRLNPRPDVSELSTIYPPSYYAYNLVDAAATASRPGPARLVEPAKRRMYQRRLGTLLDRVGPTEGTIRLLDVGCADGRLLDWYRASRYGHRIETHGVEFNESAVAVARSRGHRVVLGRFEEENELERGSFHLVLASHVIEHVDDPLGFARHAADLLVPGGLLVVGTPNFDSPDARFLGRHWGGSHFPRHWTFYDAGTIGALAASVGLAVDHIDYEPNPVFWNWSFHSWLKDRSPRLADRLFPPVGIFCPSPQSFLLLSIFTAVDLALRAVSGKTASMSVLMRKPA